MSLLLGPEGEDVFILDRGADCSSVILYVVIRAKRYCGSNGGVDRTAIVIHLTNAPTRLPKGDGF